MASTELSRALEQFRGKTADQIAEIVEKRGIKGRMGTTYGCPLAVLLDHQSTGAFVVGRKYIARQSGRHVEKARTPENLAAFLRRFDIGKYPNLVAPPPRCLAKDGVSRPKRSRAPDTRVKRKREIKNHLGKLVQRFAAA